MSSNRTSANVNAPRRGFPSFIAPALLTAAAALAAACTIYIGSQLLWFNRLLEAGDLVAANDANSLAQKRPFDPMFHLGRVDSALANGDLRLASDALTLIERLAPNDPTLLRKRISLERALGNDRTATLAAMRLAVLSPIDQAAAFTALQTLFQSSMGRDIIPTDDFATWPAALEYTAFACASNQSSATLVPLLASVSKRTTPEPVLLNCVSERASAEGNAAAARWLWLSAAPQLPQRIGHVFNGAFDSEPSGSRFDWQISQGGDFRDGFAASIVSAGSAGGKRVLSVRFNGRPVRSTPAAQVIALPAGRYRLSYERRESITTEPNLAIALGLRCLPTSALPDPPSLVRSRDAAPATASTDWQRISTEFTVPTLCSSQQLSTDFVSTMTATLGRTGTTLLSNVRIEEITPKPGASGSQLPRTPE